MNQLYSSESVKGLFFKDHPLPILPHRQNITFPINAFAGQANKPMAVPWLLERRAVKTVLIINQPGFNAVNLGGDHC